MKAAGQQNDLDLQAIVKEVDATFADSISFVFPPGDNADHGDIAAYTVVRQALDSLRVSWCAIVGDHDVEQKSFCNFKAFLAEQTHYALTVGPMRFRALERLRCAQAFLVFRSPEQLRWIDDQLRAPSDQGQEKVLLLHCYPSDLKQGGDELKSLISMHGVKLVDMGHTHYNQIAHDGKTVTRQLGQPVRLKRARWDFR